MDPRAALLLADRGLAELAADPIKAFRFSSKAQRNFVKATHKFREVYLRAASRSGKTTVGANTGTALSQGRTTLDGESLPLLGTPNVGVVLAKGRAMAEESVIKAYRKAIGDWPHHIERNGTATSAIWVKPVGSRSEDWRDWSVIRFFVEAGQSVAGMRLDWAHADEPPDWNMWMELRTRAKANRHFIRFITATPIDKREWKPLRDDFKGCEWPRGKDGKVEIRMSVYDNSALSREDIKAMENDTRGPLQKAKLLGEYVDLTGTNPFDAEGLKRWAERCTEGKSHEGLTPSGTPYIYEVWETPEEGNGYLVVADPSAGIEDEQHDHDPAGIVVVSRRQPYTVVARYNGYMASRDLGWLSAKLATEYNRALLVWERNSGYGESFFHGLSGYGNVYIEHHHDARGLPLSQRLGWTTTATTRGTIIGALQKAILQDGLVLFSAAAVDSLGSVVLKRDGLRPEAGAGSHDEDMIILGLACHLLETMPFYAPPRELGSVKLARDLGLRMNRPARTPDPFAAGY